MAANPNTPSGVLGSLLPATIESNADAEVVGAVVRNPATKPATLAKVPDLILPRLHAQDDPFSFGTGVELTRRADTSAAALSELITDERSTTEFRKVIARETTSTNCACGY